MKKIKIVSVKNLTRIYRKKAERRYLKFTKQSAKAIQRIQRKEKLTSAKAFKTYIRERKDRTKRRIAKQFFISEKDATKVIRLSFKEGISRSKEVSKLKLSGKLEFKIVEESELEKQKTSAEIEEKEKPPFVVITPPDAFAYIQLSSIFEEMPSDHAREAGDVPSVSEGTIPIETPLTVQKEGFVFQGLAGTFKPYKLRQYFDNLYPETTKSPFIWRTQPIFKIDYIYKKGTGELVAVKLY